MQYKSTINLSSNWCALIAIWTSRCTFTSMWSPSYSRNWVKREGIYRKTRICWILQPRTPKRQLCKARTRVASMNFWPSLIKCREAATEIRICLIKTTNSSSYWFKILYQLNTKPLQSTSITKEHSNSSPISIVSSKMQVLNNSYLRKHEKSKCVQPISIFNQISKWAPNLKTCLISVTRAPPSTSCTNKTTSNNKSRQVK